MHSASTRKTESALRRWAAGAATSLRLVADRPALWLPGGLAWLTTVGWIPFLLVVARVPSVAELTYFGAGFWTSGLWPLNAILLAAGAVAVVVLALALASAGNAVLIASGEGRRASARDAGALLLVGLLGAMPVAICVLTIAVALVAVGPAEFNRPGVVWSPILGVAVRIGPVLVFSAVVVIAASTLAGVAGRAALREGSVARGLPAAFRLAAGAERAGLWHLASAVAVGIGYLAISGLLLSVLWAPLRAGLERGAPLDLASGLLLVGFVAIWLCLVLAGGAVHAWASVTATILLRRRATGNVAERPQEMLLDR